LKENKPETVFTFLCFDAIVVLLAWLFDFYISRRTDMRVKLDSCGKLDSMWQVVVLAFAVFIFFFCLSFLVADQSVNSAEIGITWEPNKEQDLSGYKLYYGTASREYSYVETFDNATSHSVSFGDNATGRTYYAALKAYDTSGNESAFSDEVSFVVGQNDLTDTDKVFTFELHIDEAEFRRVIEVVKSQL
jgi:hypothetical protein